MKNNQPTQTEIPQGPTKNCKHCKSIIPKGAKICPICHKKQRGIGKWILIVIIVLIIFAAIGGIACCGILFLIFYFDTRIKSKEEVEELLNLEVLAVIPEIKE